MAGGNYVHQQFQQLIIHDSFLVPSIAKHCLLFKAILLHFFFSGAKAKFLKPSFDFSCALQSTHATPKFLPSEFFPWCVSSLFNKAFRSTSSIVLSHLECSLSAMSKFFYTVDCFGISTGFCCWIFKLKNNTVFLMYGWYMCLRRKISGKPENLIGHLCTFIHLDFDQYHFCPEYFALLHYITILVFFFTLEFQAQIIRVFHNFWKKANFQSHLDTNKITPGSFFTTRKKSISLLGLKNCNSTFSQLSYRIAS